MDTALYLLIIMAPATHAAAVRQALAEAGAGRLGEYDSCSFSVSGTGRFRPSVQANPHVGAAGTLEEVEEERIETVVHKDQLPAVLQAATKAHPYEEPAIYVVPMLDYHDFTSGTASAG